MCIQIVITGNCFFFISVRAIGYILFWWASVFEPKLKVASEKKKKNLKKIKSPHFHETLLAKCRALQRVRLSVRTSVFSEWCGRESSPSTESCHEKNRAKIPENGYEMEAINIVLDHLWKGGVYQRDTDKQEWVCLTRLVPFLHEYSLLWTKPRLLQCDVIVQVGELPPGKVGDEFKTFIRVTFGLDVSNQGLEMRKRKDEYSWSVCENVSAPTTMQTLSIAPLKACQASRWQ